jgi:hypothetical protein
MWTPGAHAHEFHAGTDFHAPHRAIMLTAVQHRIGRRGTSTEDDVLNRSDRFNHANGEAEVKYLDGDFRVIRPGAFVRCAVTGLPIPLEELKYWDVDRQEAYVSPEAVMQRRTSAAGA